MPPWHPQATELSSFCPVPRSVQIGNAPVCAWPAAATQAPMTAPKRASSFGLISYPSRSIDSTWRESRVNRRTLFYAWRNESGSVRRPRCIFASSTTPIGSCKSCAGRPVMVWIHGGGRRGRSRPPAGRATCSSAIAPGNGSRCTREPARRSIATRSTESRARERSAIGTAYRLCHPT